MDGYCEVKVAIPDILQNAGAGNSLGVKSNLHKNRFETGETDTRYVK